MFSEEHDDILKPEKLPIFRKSQEIIDLVNKITDLIPGNDEYLMEIKCWMLSDAAQLTAKTAGAEAGKLYDIKFTLIPAFIFSFQHGSYHFLSSLPGDISFSHSLHPAFSFEVPLGQSLPTSILYFFPLFQDRKFS